MKYGLPYKGSKNRLAEHIVRLMPKADHLIDLFCGGCAVSHAAMLAGKYKHIHINDCDWRPVTLFMDVLAGRYQDDTRWISREQFIQLKDTDPYVAIIWSFGNNMRDYLYSREIEPLKRAIHYAIFYDDYKPAAELGHDLTFIDQLTDTRRKYIAVKRYFEQYGHFQQQSFEGGAELYKQAGALRTERMQSLESWGGTTTQSNDQESASISRADIAYYRLQYRERHHALPHNSGGAKSHFEYSGLCRCGYPKRQRSILRHTLS